MKDPSQLAESKLIIIYMIHKMNLAVGITYIQEFALSFDYMDYFSLSTYLADLEKNKYIIKKIDHNKTTYEVSVNGRKTLELFENLIPKNIKKNIDEYVILNKNQAKRDLEIVATYKENSNHYFNIMCGVYEDKLPIMELSIKVSSKKYAKKICENWEKDASKYYIEFLKSLLEEGK